MNIKELRQELAQLYTKHFNDAPTEINGLPLSGSNRKYFRLTGKSNSVIGTYNNDVKENEAFFYLSAHLKKSRVHVPEVFIISNDKQIYLQEDLGDKSLYDYIQGKSEEDILKIYKKVIDQMPRLQIKSAVGLDFSVCYPRAAFDEQSIRWDLNYFKYMFLKVAGIDFSEQELEDDFEHLLQIIGGLNNQYFLFRDFQSRNIMLKGTQVCFIDFQGGRKGVLQYDLASLLYESKTGLKKELRGKLLDYYIQVFNQHSGFDERQFNKFFPLVAMLRVLQAFGAYGYRGLIEKKAFFVQSIIPGIKNLKEIIQDKFIQKEFKYLVSIINNIDAASENFIVPESKDNLTLNITSFSYRKAIPNDWSGNGGGYVFDCRALPNPGRYQQYKSSTGRDADVIDFLEEQTEVKSFLAHVTGMVDASVKNYQKRGFNNLSISFGCTGGQHRSVYCAEKLYEHLKVNYDVKIMLHHREQKIREIHDKIDL